MRILLDTHIFIWMATEPERLSPRFTESIIDRQNSLFLSLASIWEIQIKVGLGKLDLKGDLATIVDIQTKENSIQLLSIELKHIYALSNLPAHHRDPFVGVASPLGESLANCSVSSRKNDFSQCR
ncbi:type II toxin-antitoxin system VapC family toxin [Chamaesiphon sp. VAR_48_metabat_135_sub]|uniref:type II toxin-antitoxin system VapC family toxin n=1 Tax=Chamaesiphon sp. VAR_48_metabat_135_sub TaxID=2964699 RepID=UPI00286C247E|nr:type II toxin-antitoxin system VapC family toxin [Chamaesiphon sp. VAR_48_metabat_135_sub]